MSLPLGNRRAPPVGRLITENWAGDVMHCASDLGCRRASAFDLCRIAVCSIVCDALDSVRMPRELRKDDYPKVD